MYFRRCLVPLSGTALRVSTLFLAMTTAILKTAILKTGIKISEFRSIGLRHFWQINAPQIALLEPVLSNLQHISLDMSSMEKPDAKMAMEAIVVNAANVTRLCLTFGKDEHVMPLSNLYTQRKLWPRLIELSLDGFKTR
jgi:hypothetical protein